MKGKDLSTNGMQSKRREISKWAVINRRVPATTENSENLNK